MIDLTVLIVSTFILIFGITIARLYYIISA